MKRRKTVLENQETIYRNDNVSIINVENQIIFEIKEHTTLDLAEAVSLLISYNITDKEIWNLSISHFDKNVIPEKSLYWLSGGDKEWIILENYCYSWYNCYQDFCNKWGSLVTDTINESVVLYDIKIKFNEKLNLMTFYDWAISKGFVV